ncbi:MAG: ATP-dependent helicase HrpB [Gemmatimonadetes bacterium]|nr:ATP-dependent helicase HrpB [Gemmatimonadota bacterium]
MQPLPIDAAIPELRRALRDATGAVLEAPPGAGKTTRVPLALLDEPWLAGRRIVMLEPRRLAARAAARHMASLLGQRVGDTVGYRVRMDTRVSAATRIEVVTEGVLTRMLQDDPALEGVGLVIFDEFHERSLHADLGLALALESRDVLRPELRLLVMSATLDGAPVARLLGGAPVVTSAGRSWPVETHYLARRREGPLEPAVARAVLRALERHDGDVLVFLPGAAEIRRTAERLRAAVLPPGTRVLPLHGNLPAEEQDRALAPSRPGERKVVLATSIAETSLTIEGVRVVVDAGLMRVPRFSPRTGMTSLETVAVTRASADQRRGRAGRLGPGVAYRLWTEAEDRQLLAHGEPEILAADLAPLALELAAWGAAPEELRWLDPPPAAAFAQARELLRELGALGPDGAITPHGRRMAALPTHPRLAHMLLVGNEIGLGGLAAELAALLGERDILRGDDSPPEADVRLRLEALRGAEARPSRSGAGRAAERAGRPAADPDASFRGFVVDRGARERARAEAREWRRRLRVPPGDVASDEAGLLLAHAYPDRVGQRRPGQRGRFLLRNGRGASLPESEPLAAEEWIVAAQLEGRGRESRIFLAAPVTLEALEQSFAEQIEEEDVVAWDDGADGVRARRRRRLGALVLREAPLPDPDPERVRAAVLERLAREGVDALPWSDEAVRLRRRLAFLRRLDASWPDVSTEALAATLPEWLGPYLDGVRGRADLARLDLARVLEARLSWEQRRRLDEWAPTHIEVPSGSRIAVDYSDPAAPVLAVRLQEVFGLMETPRIGGGRVPLTLHLLSPAHRPVQVTRDLASFWRSGYFEVRKDLKGRYPKHYWPDDPLTATPTRRTRPR